LITLSLMVWLLFREKTGRKTEVERNLPIAWNQVFIDLFLITYYN
jgi:hypothetical protein